MASTAEAPPEVLDLDSQDDGAEELTEDWDAPPSSESAAEAPEVPSAAVDADAAGQPDAESAAPDIAGPARDAQGRFLAKEPGQEAPAVPSEPIAAAPPPEPFAFRVDGVPVSVDGATVVGDEIRIPRQRWERDVQPRLVDRGQIARRETRMQATIEQLRTEKSAKEQRAEAILQRMDDLLGDPKKLLAFAQNYQVEAPRLKLEIENEILRSENQRTTTRLTETSQSQSLEEFNTQARPALDNAVGVAVERIAEGFALDASVRTELADHLWALSESGTPVFFEVKEGDGSGLDPAEHRYGVNLHLIATIVKPMIEREKRAVQAAKATQVAQQNAKALGKAPVANKPPATVPTKGSPTPGGEERTFKNADEYNEYMRTKYRIP